MALHNRNSGIRRPKTTEYEYLTALCQAELCKQPFGRMFRFRVENAKTFDRDQTPKLCPTCQKEAKKKGTK